MVASFDPYFVRKIPGAFGVTLFERDKNFWNLFLAKLKTAITFALGIRITIIVYAFGIEKNFPYCDASCRLPNSKNQPFTKFFFYFSIIIVLFF